MEILLKNEFTKHYHLQTSDITNLNHQIDFEYFELKDDVFVICSDVGCGIAKFKNPLKSNINIVNYELFIHSLPNNFTIGREKCDLIVHSSNKQCLLLIELTDTLAKYVEPYLNTKGIQIGKREKAKSQLIASLVDLMKVEKIKNFVNSFLLKQCCFFNKQSNSPNIIVATTAFNRINNLTFNGFKMSNPTIESYGFEYNEYSDNQYFKIS